MEPEVHDGVAEVHPRRGLDHLDEEVARGGEESDLRLDVDGGSPDDARVHLEGGAVEDGLAGGRDRGSPEDDVALAKAHHHPFDVRGRVGALDPPAAHVVLHLGDEPWLWPDVPEVEVEPLEEVVRPVPPQRVGEGLGPLPLESASWPLYRSG